MENLADIKLNDENLILEGKKVTINGADTISLKAENVTLGDINTRFIETSGIKTKDFNLPLGTPPNVGIATIRGEPYFKQGLIADDLYISLIDNKSTGRVLREFGKQTVLMKGFRHQQLPGRTPSTVRHQNDVPNMLPVISLGQTLKVMNDTIKKLEERLKKLEDTE